MSILPSCKACGDDAVVLFPGSDPEVAPGGITIRRGTEGFGLCLADAKARGWPWCFGGEPQMELHL